MSFIDDNFDQITDMDSPWNEYDDPDFGYTPSWD